MLKGLGITEKKIATYDRKDFYDNWDKVNKNLGERWDNVIKFNPHHGIGRTMTDKYWISAITKLLGEWMPNKKGLKVLKFDTYNEATGTAQLTDWLLSRGYDYWGIDISKEVIKRAKKNFGHKIPASRFVLGDIRKMPFKKNTFDVVWSFGTIEHIRENQEAVDEAFRVLKPGGLFITGINNRIDMWGSYFVNELTNKVYKHITSYEPSFFPWQQRKWLINAGFERVSTTGMVMLPHIFHYGDLFMEWKKVNGPVKFAWDNLIIRPWIGIAKVLDGFDPIRIFAMHTTSYGYKPLSSGSQRKS